MTDLERKYVQGDGWKTVPAEGGGSQPGVPVYYSFAFAFDDAGLEDGITAYTPSDGERLYDAWFEFPVAFDGTSPKCDIGAFADGQTQGIFKLAAGNTYMVPDAADVAAASGPYTVRGNAGNANLNSYYGNGNGNGASPVILTTAPLQVCVSQDGLPGGDPVGGAAGVGRLIFAIVTPTSSPG